MNSDYTILFNFNVNYKNYFIQLIYFVSAVVHNIDYRLKYSANVNRTADCTVLSNSISNRNWLTFDAIMSKMMS